MSSDGTWAQRSGQTLLLTPAAVLLEQSALPAYRPEAFVSDGFVHCTDGEAALLAVANRYFHGDPRPFLLLDIDLSRVAAPVVYENLERRYPHVYGPIERVAVRPRAPRRAR